MARLLLINSESAVLKQIEDALHIAHELKKTSIMPSQAPMPPGQQTTANLDQKLAHETDHEIFVENSDDKIEEILNQKLFDAILVDDHHMKNSFTGWGLALRKKISLTHNQTIPIAVLSYDERVETVRKFMMKGIYADYIVLPVDAPIFREKISLMISKKNIYNKEIYSMPVNEPVRVAYNFEIEDIGEFGLTLKCSKQYNVGEFLSFFAQPFAQDGSQEVIGKCYSAEKHPVDKDSYKCKFIFVGNGPSFKKNVRTWLQQEYVRKKQAS